MDFLKEVMSSAIMLNNLQKGILAAVYSAATPELAFETTNGAEALVVQREQLAKLGFINVGMNMVNFTDYGQRALVTNNVVGEDGKLTPDGEKYLKGVETERKKVQANESFDFIRSLAEESGK